MADPANAAPSEAPASSGIHGQYLLDVPFRPASISSLRDAHAACTGGDYSPGLPLAQPGSDDPLQLAIIQLGKIVLERRPGQLPSPLGVMLSCGTALEAILAAVNDHLTDGLDDVQAILANHPSVPIGLRTDLPDEPPAPDERWHSLILPTLRMYTLTNVITIAQKAFACAWSHKNNQVSASAASHLGLTLMTLYLRLHREASPKAHLRLVRPTGNRAGDLIYERLSPPSTGRGENSGRLEPASERILIALKTLSGAMFTSNQLG